MPVNGHVDDPRVGEELESHGESNVISPCIVKGVVRPISITQSGHMALQPLFALPGASVKIRCHLRQNKVQQVQEPVKGQTVQEPLKKFLDRSGRSTDSWLAQADELSRQQL